MSLHLDRLVARAQGRLPTVQPRVPARFEPWQADADLMERAPSASDGIAAPTLAPALPVERIARSSEAMPPEPVSIAGPPAPVDAPAAPRRETVPARPPPIVQAIESIVRFVEDAAVSKADPEPRVAAKPRAPERRAASSAPTRRPAQRMVAPDAPASAERVVQVTIGRVDVRAIMPTPAPQPQPQPQSRTARTRGSLEDWLAGRGER